MSAYPRRSYVVDGSAIRFQSGAEVLFDFPIAETCDFAEMIVVRLSIPDGTVYSENVFAVSLDGRIAWQIAKRDHFGTNPRYVEVRGADVAKLFDAEGFLRYVDVITGEIIKEVFVK